MAAAAAGEEAAASEEEDLSRLRALFSAGSLGGGGGDGDGARSPPAAGAAAAAAEVVGPRRGRRKPWPASWSPPASVCSRCPKLMGLKLMGLVGLLSKLRWPIAHRGEPFMKEISSSEVS